MTVRLRKPGNPEDHRGVAPARGTSIKRVAMVRRYGLAAGIAVAGIARDGHASRVRPPRMPATGGALWRRPWRAYGCAAQVWGGGACTARRAVQASPVLC